MEWRCPLQCACVSNYVVEGTDDLVVTAQVDGGDSWSELVETNNSLVHTVDVLNPDTEVVPNLCYLKPATATSQESSELGAVQRAIK